jgi:hypothetical protein
VNTDAPAAGSGGGGQVQQMDMPDGGGAPGVARIHETLSENLTKNQDI